MKDGVDEVMVLVVVHQTKRAGTTDTEKTDKTGVNVFKCAKQQSRV